MPSTSHYSPLSVIVSSSCYRAPLKLSFLYLTPRRLFHHRFRAIYPPELATALTALSYRCCRLPNNHFFTGNSLFSRMEVWELLHIYKLCVWVCDCCLFEGYLIWIGLEFFRYDYWLCFLLEINFQWNLRITQCYIRFCFIVTFSGMIESLSNWQVVGVIRVELGTWCVGFEVSVAVHHVLVLNE